jgi:glycosyltransferase involved in cell wall biosynthesis
MDARIFSTRKLMEEVEQQYRENNLPQAYFKKLYFIDNAIDIPVYQPVVNEELQVFFIGRGSPQKRVHLVAGIAQKIHEKKLPVKFNFVGDVSKMININDYPYCRFYGNVKEEEEMKRIYEIADVLMLTSAFEGMPVVIMQMMSYGKVVVSTAVSGIPDYIFHEQNGLLIFSTEESAIIEEGVNLLERLLKDDTLRKSLGAKARKDAIEKFSRQSFETRYREILGF